MKRIIAALIVCVPTLALADYMPQTASPCPPGQHIGPRDKDSSYRECVPDRPKRPEPPPPKPVIHKPACPDPYKQCPACILKAEECPDCVCNPAPSITLPYIGEPYETEVEYHEPYSSLPPPGHWVTGLGVFRLPASKHVIDWNVVEIDHYDDPIITIHERPKWMPFASAGWEFAGGTRLMGHVGYVVGGDARLSATPLHYGPYRRVRGLDVRGDSGGVSVGVSVEKTWK